MARLIEDAAKLSDTVDAQDMSFANIVKAINVVQTEMGITGTTALEAGRTIEGSVNSMKAAWSNLMTGIADDNADLEGLIENFVTSLVGDGTENNLGVIGNVLPAVEKAIGGVGSLVEKLVPKLVDRIPALLTGTVPKLIKSAINTLKSVVQSIGKNAKIVVRAAKDLVLDFIDGMVDMLPDIIEAAIELFTGIIEAIPDVVANLDKNIPKIIDAVVKGLAKGTGAVAKAIIGLFIPFDEQVEQASRELGAFLETVVSFSEKVNEAAQKTADLTDALSKNGKTATEIEEEIEETEEKITEILKKAFKNQDRLRQEDIKKIKEYNAKIIKLEEEKLSIYQDQQLAEVRKTQLELKNMSPDKAAENLGAAKAALKASNEVVEEAYNNRIILIENRHKAANTINSTAYKNDLKSAKKWADEQKKTNQGYYDEVLQMVSNTSEEWIKKETKSWEKLSEARKGYQETTKKINGGIFQIEWEWLNNINDSANDALGVYDDWTESYIKLFKEIDYESSNAFLKLQANLKSSGKEIKAENVEAIETILSAFGNLPETANEEGKKYLLKLIDGMEETIPELTDASNMTVEEIVSVLKEKLVQKNTIKSFGENIIDGIIKGLKSKSKWSGLINAVTKIGDVIKTTFADNFEIHSPSKVFKRFGENMVDGLIIGWEDNIDNMQDAMDNSLNFDDEYEVLSSSTSMRDFGENSQINNASQSLDIKVGIDETANAMGLARALLPLLKVVEKEMYV